LDRWFIAVFFWPRACCEQIACNGFHFQYNKVNDKGKNAMYQFSSYQIAEMGMEIEVAGAKFYALLANSTQDKKLKDIFTILSKAEIEHREVFRCIADTFRMQDVSEYSIDLEADMKNHIMELKEIVLSFQSLPKAPANILEAIEIAIKTETNAVRIYTEILTSLTEKFHGVLSAIINEERKHLEMLLGIKDKFSLKD